MCFVVDVRELKLFQKQTALFKYSNMVMENQILNSIPPFITQLLDGHFICHLTDITRNSDISFEFEHLLKRMNSGKIQ
jgi:hypothetical protein